MGEHVVVLGASDNPARFAYRAISLLTQFGHIALPVSPHCTEVQGTRCARALTDIATNVDTITVYLRPELAEPLGEAMIGLRPRRIIFNPGTESVPLKQQLEAAGIRVQWECTLILLRSGAYLQ